MILEIRFRERLFMEYSNKEELNKDFSCFFCGGGEHGLGKNERFICFSCIYELVKCHDSIVKPELRIKAT
jgi:hypothetical protein